MFLRTEYHVFLKDLLLDDAYKVGSTYAVMVAGSAALATIYASNTSTSAASNPGSGDSNGNIRFFTDNTVTSVDITIYTANGEAIFIRGLTPSKHGVFVDRQKLEQNLVIPVLFNDNSETTTGFTLVGPVAIEDIDLIVETIDATETIDVGLDGTTNNDPNGLIAAASVAAVGLVELGGAVNNGTNIDFVDAITYGALLRSFINGSDAVTTNGGWAKNKAFIAVGETDANITTTGSAGSDTFVGWIIVKLKKLMS